MEEFDYDIFSAFGYRLSARVFLLIGHSLNTDVNVIFSGEVDMP